MNKEYRHIPVMLGEVIEYLNPQSGQRFIDCTLGGAGYTLAIAERVGEIGKVLSVDLDEMAIKNAEKQIKEKLFNNIILVNENFRELSKIVEEYFPRVNNQKSGEESVKFDGIVFDLGLSSAQLEDQSRGFSFQLDAPLNMAFSGSKDEDETENILNSYKPEKIERIIREYGEEKFARRITERIVENRKLSRIKTTKQLVDIIAQAIPSVYRNNKKIHFATRTFQAIRIATNKELESIEDVLPQAMKLLRKGGKMVVISYHSLEDRIIKNFFKTESRDCVCPSSFPVCQCKHQAGIKIITKKPLLPSEEEINKNPRARSAKMRIAEKII